MNKGSDLLHSWNIFKINNDFTISNDIKILLTAMETVGVKIYATSYDINGELEKVKLIYDDSMYELKKT